MRVLIFHPALAPYRVDFFNELGKRMNLRVVFMTRNNANQTFNQNELLKDSTYSYGYLDRHHIIFKRNINFGYSEEIRNFKPDIVICNEFGISLWVSYFVKLSQGKKYKLLTICDDSEDVFNNRSGLRKTVTQFFTKHINGIICINPKVTKCYKLIGAKNTFFFPIIYKNSLFCERLKSSVPITNDYISRFNLEGCKCLLFVGRFTAVKNLELLVKAFSLVTTESSQEIRLILVGDGELKQSLINQSKELGLDSKVIFPGRYEGDQLLAWYNLKGSCVLVSTHEPFGAVIAEALMAGMPALVSDKVGANCLITPDNGMICHSDNVDDIAVKMKKMLDIVGQVERLEKTNDSIIPYDFDSLMDDFINSLQA